MYLQKLQVQGIRNIVRADLSLSPGANLFYGLNGSGKTSLLEAVHLLARGRSFRTRNLKTVINLDDRSCTCFGLVCQSSDPGATSVPIGVMRNDQGRFVFKVNGEQVHSASRLAESLPVQIVNAESFQLLEGSPGGRRSFVDWGVFHVEHSFRELWGRFQRCLKHRNSLLRHGKIDPLQLTVWDREFCGLAEEIDRRREQYLAELHKYLPETLDKLGLSGEFQFRYVPGWDQRQGLQHQLTVALSRDQKVGFTQHGPHRADLRIYSGKHLAADVLSRGQIKTLVFALKIVQGRVLMEKTGLKCLFLLDDLPSELDEHHRRSVSRELANMGVQVLVTGVERRDLESLEFPDIPAAPKLFHVKHGNIELDNAT